MSAPAVDARHCFRTRADSDLLSRPLRILPARCTGCGANLANLEVPYRAARSAAFHGAISGTDSVTARDVARAREEAEAYALGAVGAVRLCCRSTLRSWVGSADAVTGGVDSRPCVSTMLRNTRFKPPLEGVDCEVRLQARGAPAVVVVRAAAARVDAAVRII